MLESLPELARATNMDTVKVIASWSNKKVSGDYIFCECFFTCCFRKASRSFFRFVAMLLQNTKIDPAAMVTAYRINAGTSNAQTLISMTNTSIANIPKILSLSWLIVRL